MAFVQELGHTIFHQHIDRSGTSVLILVWWCVNKRDKYTIPISVDVHRERGWFAIHSDSIDFSVTEWMCLKRRISGVGTGFSERLLLFSSTRTALQ